MFSGIVSEVGCIEKISTTSSGKHLRISATSKLCSSSDVGDSIAVNGVCLTVTNKTSSTLNFDLAPETLKRTNLTQLSVSSSVNLEAALNYGQKVGGHLVQGHIDTVSEVIKLEESSANGYLLTFSIDNKYSHYLVDKGFIAIDGLSITLIDTKPTFFTVMIIPHTLQSTIVKHYFPGYFANIEVDPMGRYIEKLMRKST